MTRHFPSRSQKRARFLKGQPGRGRLLPSPLIHAGYFRFGDFFFRTGIFWIESYGGSRASSVRSQKEKMADADADAGRQCAACKQVLAADKFSKKQWLARAYSRRCAACVEGGAAPQVPPALRSKGFLIDRVPPICSLDGTVLHQSFPQTFGNSSNLGNSSSPSKYVCGVRRVTFPSSNPSTLRARHRRSKRSCAR